MKAFTMPKQMAVGDWGAGILDARFGDEWDIHAVTRGAEREGKDRMFIHRETGERRFVEYKTDVRAQETGNAFVELRHVATDGRWWSGWALTCRADALFYYVPGPGWELVYVLEPEAVRQALGPWRERYPYRHSHNDGYNSYARVVPLRELERLAQEVISL